MPLADWSVAHRAPLLTAKDYGAPSAFLPANLLREARRQNGQSVGDVPAICVLDPDGDIVANVIAAGRAVRHPAWACYHSRLHVVTTDGFELGIIGGAVGAPYAVLVAEQLFVSGCQLLTSMTSAGQITPLGQPPYFVLIDRAMRDEGTSYHYLPPDRFAAADPALVTMAVEAVHDLKPPVHRGAVWTTDAPFRETEAAINQARSEGILAVEMEAAALLSFASARQCAVICFAHVTNQLATVVNDFEKGAASGSLASLMVIERVARLAEARLGLRARQSAKMVPT
jgi:uridine phosphorylase